MVSDKEEYRTNLYLTVDTQCERCNGIGVCTFERLSPGEPIRYGGPPAATYTVTELCSCVESNTKQ